MRKETPKEADKKPVARGRAKAPAAVTPQQLAAAIEAIQELVEVVADSAGNRGQSVCSDVTARLADLADELG